MSDDDGPIRKPRKYPFIPRRRVYAAEDRQQERRCPAVEVPPGECPLSGAPAHGTPPRVLRAHLDPGSNSPRSRNSLRRPAVSIASRMSSRDVHLAKRLNWKEQKSEILQVYTTAKNIPVQSKIVEDDEDAEPKVLTQTDKARARLEQLEEGQAERRGEQTSYYTQKDLISHIEGFATELEQSWARGEKVKALRIVIQACKMLCTVRCPAMYPSLFVLVAKVLDTFGHLVFERIYQRAVESAQVRRLPPGFDAADISHEAKDMCQNWFFKVASIRELIPRVMVEMALWRCHRFVVAGNRFFSTTLERFARQCRGVGDTLIAHHMRFYLIRKGTQLYDDFGEALSGDYAQTCVDDFYHVNTAQLHSERFERFLETNQISRGEYIRLFSPLMRWLMESLSERQTEQCHLRNHLEAYSKSCGWGMVLQHIIGSFPAAHVAALLPTVVDLIRRAETNSCPRVRLWAVLGRTLSEEPPERKRDRSAVLAEAWECAEQPDTELDSFMECAVSWVEFSVLHLERQDVSALLGSARSRLGKDKAHLQQQVPLEQILAAVLAKWAPTGGMFALGDFLPLLDMLEPERRARLCCSMLATFAAGERTVGDPVLIGSLMDVARTLHDRLTSLTDGEEVAQVGELIVGFMERVDHAPDHEAQLQFLVDCRRSFHRLGPVTAECVWSALRLLRSTVRAHGGVVKSHTKKLGAFVKACITYCHVTIPSLADPQLRAQLFLVGGALCFNYGFLPQGEALLKACVAALEDMPQPPPAETKGGRNAAAEELEAWVLRLVPSVLGVALVAPGSPQLGGLWLFEAVAAFAEGREWEPCSAARGLIHTACIASLAAMRQERLPYHFPAPYGAPSNDELFAGEEAFAGDVEDMAGELVEKVVAELERLQKVLGLATTPPPMHQPLRRRLCGLALELFEVVTQHSEMSQGLAQLVEWLWQVLGAHLPGAGEESLRRHAELALRCCQSSRDEALRAATEQLAQPRG
eukprot:TRINITY_DN16182_c0_g1_i1.p1 TRINITY_DN16182_c0_g1~~TRINITY_DN16182_c0_g1_i1.p1  ORF type:complete len:982 (+),score=374.39 TRINITY_DN16182_c0_g1_i1:91-3036(+)